MRGCSPGTEGSPCRARSFSWTASPPARRGEGTTPPGFWLGPTPYGYGINWPRSAGRADCDDGVEWPEPHDPVCLEWDGDEYVFALEGAGDDAIARARPVEIKEGMSFGQETIREQSQPTCIPGSPPLPTAARP
jgi:hypothetical protein